MGTYGSVSRKDDRASIRLTRGRLAVTTGGVRVAKVGDVRVVLSRVLRCRGVRAVIREAAVRCYASFVVEVVDTPLPLSANDVGIGLGLTSLAVLSAGEVVQSPCCLTEGEGVARAQRSLARKTKGSNRGAEAVRRVAVQHRLVRGTPLDAHHELATAWPAITRRSTARRSRWPMLAGRCWCGCLEGGGARVATGAWRGSVAGSPGAGCARCVGSAQARSLWRSGPVPAPGVAPPTIGT